MTYKNTGNIYYSDSAFKDYANLNFVAKHEYIHSSHVKLGTSKQYELEEFITYNQNYKDSGLFRGLHLDGNGGTGIYSRLNQYLYQSQGANLIDINYKVSNKLNFLYNLPRSF